MPSADFSIEVSSDIDAVQGDWEHLESKGLLTAFQTRAWLLPFYKILAPHLNATPVFVLVRDKSSGLPVMLLPLCSRRLYGLTVIEFADGGISDYNAPLIAKGFDPGASEWRELWRAVKAALGQGSMLRLIKMPHLIAGFPNPLLQCMNATVMDVAAWGTPLPPTLAEYDAHVASPDFMRSLEKKVRRLAKHGEIGYAAAQTQDEKRAVFDILAQQRQARCDVTGWSNTMADPVYRRYYESVVDEAPREFLNLGAVRIGGTVIGTMLALIHGGVFYVILPTYLGTQWQRYSLGSLVIRESVKYCFDHGIGFFDITIGDEAYKKDFGTAPSNLYYAFEPLTRSAGPPLWP